MHKEATHNWSHWLPPPPLPTHWKPARDSQKHPSLQWRFWFHTSFEKDHSCYGWMLGRTASQGGISFATITAHAQRRGCCCHRDQHQLKKNLFFPGIRASYRTGWCSAFSLFRSPHVVVVRDYWQAQEPISKQASISHAEASHSGSDHSCQYWSPACALLGSKTECTASRVRIHNRSLRLALFSGNMQDTSSPCFRNSGYPPRSPNQTTCCSLCQVLPAVSMQYLGIPSGNCTQSIKGEWCIFICPTQQARLSYLSAVKHAEYGLCISVWKIHPSPLLVRRRYREGSSKGF